MANISSVHSFMLCLSHNSWKHQNSAEEEHFYSLTGFLGNSVKKLYIAEGEKCVPTCAISEASLRGRVSTRPAGQPDPQESNTDSTVSGHHAGSTPNIGEDVWSTMGRDKRQTGIHH